jgi:cellulose synthase/poly-beta-1,6-N-acetylglucosamine synthase-like glycosyltransferase
MCRSDLTVTVVTPAYNEEHNIGGYLESLTQQSFRDFEVLVIDDGSTDNTAAVVEKYCEYLHLTLIKSPHVGWKIAKARGTAAITSDICIVFDADNLVDARCVERLVEPFNDPRVGAVSGQIRSYGSTWVVRGASLFRELQAKFRKTSTGEAAFLTGQCMAFRTSVMKAVGGLIETEQPINQDTEIAWRLHTYGSKVLCQDDAIVYHREPTTVAGVFKRRFTMGRKSVFNLWLHNRLWLTQKAWVRFYPLALVVILLVHPIVAIAFFAATFAGALWLFRKSKAPFVDKFYGWVILTIHSVAYTLGFFAELLSLILKLPFRREERIPYV